MSKNNEKHLKTKDMNTVDDFANIIKEKRPDLTKEQIKEAIAHIADEELSLDDLDNVAGGIKGNPLWWA